ncbi:1-(5-phosphoribosyl)-5-[(5-phosphoribosylamino)methylideneamino]imidazole-4-carboxamide isomerase [Nitrospira sp. Nam74]
MLVIPAIDLKDGQCVRLRQGDLKQETVYSEDPAAMAAHWQQLGGRLLHLVDLNGAVDGQPRNFSYIEKILTRISIPVQVGGGIRTMDTVRLYFSRGVHRVVLGTSVLNNPGFLEQACKEFPHRIIVGIDARDGKVAVQGWTHVSGTSVADLVQQLGGYSLAGIIYTDIAKDGMLAGPNLLALREMVDSAPVPVIASGGITSLDDLRAIRSLGSRIAGAIVGKALYDGKLDLREAIQAVAS